MSMKLLVSIGFAAHAFFGNFCMMPMVFAQGMPMPHEEHMEMVMTPVTPMSPVHCEYCLQVRSDSDKQAQDPMGCSGHCFSQVHSTITSTTSFNIPHVVAATPILISVALIPQKILAVTPLATAPPTAINTNTIVLIL